MQAPVADVYRGKYTNKDYTLEELSEKYADEVRQLCEKASVKGGGVSIFLAESMQSCGGQIVYPPGYLRRVYKLVLLKEFLPDKINKTIIENLLE